MTLDPDLKWDTVGYAAFSDLRLRPALDLLARARAAKPPNGGRVIDLGCGGGVTLGLLADLFGLRRVLGVERDHAMLHEARMAHPGIAVEEADIAGWMPAEPPAMIFSNAVLHWLSDHARLFPRLLHMLAPGGVLAVQMPRQFSAPSHALLRETAARLFPEKFHFAGYLPPVAPPAAYAELLAPAARLDIWETEYLQALHVEEGEGHPVRRFTETTAARPILSRLDAGERAAFLAAYDAALAEAYPPGPDGAVAFPFRRLFIVAGAHF